MERLQAEQTRHTIASSPHRRSRRYRRSCSRVGWTAHTLVCHRATAASCTCSARPVACTHKRCTCVMRRRPPLAHETQRVGFGGGGVVKLAAPSVAPFPTNDHHESDQQQACMHAAARPCGRACIITNRIVHPCRAPATAPPPACITRTLRSLPPGRWPAPASGTAGLARASCSRRSARL